MGNALARIAAISPLGPIFDKELRSLSRRKRTYALRFFYLGALLLLMLMAFVSSRNTYGGVAERAQRLAEQGMVFFTCFACFTWFAMALVGPVLTCTAIMSERLHKTLPVLLMTPITTWQIVGGKLFSRVLVALMLIGLSLPVLSVVRLLGGVEVHQVVSALSLCVSTVLFTASLGLLLSTLMNRAHSVILLSYAALLFLWLLMPMMGGLLIFQVLELRSPAVMQWCYGLMSLSNPFFTLMMEIFGRSGAMGTLAWYWCVLFQLGLAGGMLILSGLMLRYMARRQENRGGSAVEIAPPTPADLPLVPLEVVAPSAEPVPVAMVVAPPTTPSKPIFDNPVLWRELRRPVMASRRQGIVALVLVVGLLLLFYVLIGANSSGRHSALGEPEAQMFFAIAFCGLGTVFTCVLSATAIAQEKESDTWTLLLATPMTATQIVGGKALGLAYRMAWPLGIVILHFLLFTVTGVLSWSAFATTIWLIITGNTLWLATGMYYSLRFRTVTMAVILNLLGPVFIYLVVLIVLGILGEALNSRGDAWAQAVGLYAPYPYLVKSLESLTSWGRNNRQVWVPVFHDVPWSTFYGIVVVQGLGYLLATFLVLWHTAYRFDRIVHRARGEK